MHRDAILVHAPLGRDAELLAGTLTSAGILAEIEADFSAVLQASADGRVGSLLLTAEALSSKALVSLTEALSHQPAWSDLPVLVLVPGGRESSLIAHMESALSTLPNLTLLERPIRRMSLATVARNALRGRSRQYEVRRVLEEKERTAAAMVQSEKLAAVGRLASSIAHEINNPLESVTNLLYLMRDEEGLSQTGRDYLDTADRELARVSQIATQTLRFHRQSTLALAVRPEALLNEVLGIYKSRLANSEITVAGEYESGIAVTCYEGDIRQVLNNLVGNAFDVMRRGGTLRLRTRRRTHWTTGRKGVLFTIADNGPGMTESTRQRIFDAFYSTKGPQGTGLGLWISKRIVHQHSGHLHVRSRTGSAHGTVFRLWLPLQLTETAHEEWHPYGMT